MGILGGGLSHTEEEPRQRPQMGMSSVCSGAGREVHHSRSLVRGLQMGGMGRRA